MHFSDNASHGQPSFHCGQVGVTFHGMWRNPWLRWTRGVGVAWEQKKEVLSVLWFKWCLQRQYCDSLSRLLLQSFTTSWSSPYCVASILALNTSSDRSTHREDCHILFCQTEKSWRTHVLQVQTALALCWASRVPYWSRNVFKRSLTLSKNNNDQ